MKTEIWNGNKIRFVEKDGEWWAVAADVCAALDIKNVSDAMNVIDAENRSKCTLSTTKGAENVGFGNHDANIMTNKEARREVRNCDEF